MALAVVRETRTDNWKLDSKIRNSRHTVHKFKFTGSLIVFIEKDPAIFMHLLPINGCLPPSTDSKSELVPWLRLITSYLGKI